MKRLKKSRERGRGGLLRRGARRIRTRIRDSLFLKIYLTVLGCLTAVVVASAVYWGATGGDLTSWKARIAHFAQTMLPASDTAEETRRMVQRLGDGLKANIALYDADARLVASAGNPPPFPTKRDRKWKGRGDEIAFDAGQGRVIVASIDDLWDDGASDMPGPFGYIVLVAIVIGLAAYPVVRHLTRRLESLRTGVEQFGSGALSSRVPVDGGDEVAAVAHSFNAAAGQIEKLVTSHRSLLANASHELRSPLARLRVAVDLYDLDNPKAADQIIENLNEIDELVDEILLASRLNHVGRLEKTESLDLTAIAAEECARHGIEVWGDPTPVIGDRRLLKRLVRNLTVNALKHGEPPVNVELAQRGGKVILTVHDRGEGLPEGEEDRVFEAFYRPAGRSESAGGWGLGLALVRQIAELHGGTVCYEHGEEGGAIFVVELPAGG